VTLALVALVVLAVVIFAFVLEPIVRARGDRAVLDAAALPEHDPAKMDDDVDAEQVDGPLAPENDADERPSGRRMTLDRPAARDAS